MTAMRVGPGSDGSGGLHTHSLWKDHWKTVAGEPSAETSCMQSKRCSCQNRVKVNVVWATQQSEMTKTAPCWLCVSLGPPPLRPSFLYWWRVSWPCRFHRSDLTGPSWTLGSTVYLQELGFRPANQAVSSGVTQQQPCVVHMEKQSAAGRIRKRMQVSVGRWRGTSCVLPSHRALNPLSFWRSLLCASLGFFLQPTWVDFCYFWSIGLLKKRHFEIHSPFLAWAFRKRNI